MIKLLLRRKRQLIFQALLLHLPQFELREELVDAKLWSYLKGVHLNDLMP